MTRSLQTRPYPCRPIRAVLLALMVVTLGAIDRPAHADPDGLWQYNTIVNVDSGRYLTARRVGSGDLLSLEDTFRGPETQHFILRKWAAHQYTFGPRQAEWQVVCTSRSDTSSDRQYKEPGHPLWVYQWMHGGNQFWDFERVSPWTFRIRNLNSGLYMAADGDRVTQRPLSAAGTVWQVFPTYARTSPRPGNRARVDGGRVFYTSNRLAVAVAGATARQNVPWSDCDAGRERLADRWYVERQLNNGQKGQVPVYDSSARGRGDTNTAALLTACGGRDTPAKICADFVRDGATDWFLPSYDDLMAIPTSGTFLLELQNRLFWHSTVHPASDPRPVRINYRGGDSFSESATKADVICVRYF